MDGKIHKIQTTRFDYDRDDLLAPWQVSCPNDDLQLTFTPQGRHREHLDLKLFASNFNQLFGRFDGHVTLTDGRRLQIENLYGFVEEQYAKW